LAVAIASRAALFTLAYFSSEHVYRRAVDPKLQYAEAHVFRGALGHLFNPWAHWDGVWYIRIASHGYRPFADSQAFFPLYPLLTRAVGRLLGDNYELGGILVSLCCFIAMCALLYKLVEREFGPRPGFFAIVYLCVFPTSLFLQAVYTESLFLLLAVACFFFARRGTWPLAGLAGLGAAATHVSGVVLVLPMALLYLRERGWRWSAVGPSAASLLLVPLGLLFWMVYLKRAFGDALLFRHAQTHWGRRFALPWQAIYRGVVATYDDVQGRPYEPLVAHRGDPFADKTQAYYAAHPALSDALLLGNVSSLVALAVAVIAVALGARRLPLAYTAFSVAILALPLFGPPLLKPMMSFPRFALEAFPIFIVFALVTDRRPLLRTALLVLSGAGLAYFTIRFAGFWWVA
jgi:Mannosyltransferase (PIG-V)